MLRQADLEMFIGAMPEYKDKATASIPLVDGLKAVINHPDIDFKPDLYRLAVNARFNLCLYLNLQSQVAAATTEHKAAYDNYNEVYQLARKLDPTDYKLLTALYIKWGFENNIDVQPDKPVSAGDDAKRSFVAREYVDFLQFKTLYREAKSNNSPAAREKVLEYLCNIGMGKEYVNPWMDAHPAPAIAPTVRSTLPIAIATPVHSAPATAIATPVPPSDTDIVKGKEEKKSDADKPLTGIPVKRPRTRSIILPETNEEDKNIMQRVSELNALEKEQQKRMLLSYEAKAIKDNVLAIRVLHEFNKAKRKNQIEKEMVSDEGLYGYDQSESNDIFHFSKRAYIYFSNHDYIDAKEERIKNNDPRFDLAMTLLEYSDSPLRLNNAVKFLQNVRADFNPEAKVQGRSSQKEFFRRLEKKLDLNLIDLESPQHIAILKREVVYENLFRKLDQIKKRSQLKLFINTLKTCYGKSVRTKELLDAVINKYDSIRDTEDYKLTFGSWFNKNDKRSAVRYFKAMREREDKNNLEQKSSPLSRDVLLNVINTARDGVFAKILDAFEDHIPKEFLNAEKALEHSEKFMYLAGYFR